MHAFEAKPKKWGNSLGVTIPTAVIKEEGVTTGKKIKIIVISNRMDEIKKTFGTLKMKKSTQRIMDEIDEGYD